MDLGGRVTIVTGAGGGIGRAISLRLARAGACIVAADIDGPRAERVVEEVADAGGRAMALEVDVTQAREVERMVERTVVTFETVDGLVNNAGYGRPIASVLDITEEEWDRSVTLNLKSVFLCSRAVVRVLLGKKSGRIVNIASLAGRSASTLFGADYTAAKAGVLGLTRHLARDLAPHGIRVNAVCPGPVDTELVRGPLGQPAMEAIARQIPMRRLGRPEDVAGVVAFLLSPEADYITGACLDVNGGLLMI